MKLRMVAAGVATVAVPAAIVVAVFVNGRSATPSLGTGGGGTAALATSGTADVSVRLSGDGAGNWVEGTVSGLEDRIEDGKAEFENRVEGAVSGLEDRIHDAMASIGSVDLDDDSDLTVAVNVLVSAA